MRRKSWIHRKPGQGSSSHGTTWSRTGRPVRSAITPAANHVRVGTGLGEGPRGNLARQTAFVPRPGRLGGLAVKDMLYWSLAVPATVVVALILLRLMKVPI